MSRGRGRPPQGARDAVLAAARDLFVARDYADVSIDDILERSGVSRGALYHHFPTKLELFRAVYEESETRVLAGIGTELEQAASPLDALVLGARAYLRRCEDDEELRRIGLTQSRSVLGWEGWREAAANLGLGVITAMVAAAVEAGELPDHGTETTAHILLAALIEAGLLVATAPDRAAARERAEALMADMIEGLAAVS